MVDSLDQNLAELMRFLGNITFTKSFPFSYVGLEGTAKSTRQ